MSYWMKVVLFMLTLVIGLLILALGLIITITLGVQAHAYTGLTTEDACRVLALERACR